MTPNLTAVRPRTWFRLDRHAGVRGSLPAGIQAMLQNGMLDRVFRDALVPEFLFPQIADSEPWMGGLGDTKIFTRKGLLAPATAPVTGSDPSPATYNIEQWSVTMDQYGNTEDTNMLGSKMALASKWLADCQTLAINAGQSVNQVARNKLYKAYAGGRTWCTTAASTDTSIIVNSTDGFEYNAVNGVPVAVSGANPLNVMIAGVANTVTGVNTGTKTLTLGTTRTDVVGDYVVAANAPVSIRATGNSAYDLTSANVATFANFRAGVARLRKMNVPTLPGGYYIAHIDADTEAQLFNDADFKQALQGRVDSPIFTDLSIGRFGGLDWVRNLEAPTTLGGNAGPPTLTIHRPIILGANALMNAPLDISDLLAGTGVEDIPEIRYINVAPGVDVKLIIRPPQDRFQQVISSTWSWVGDFGVPTDAGSGDAALYKRGVVIEHA